MTRDWSGEMEQLLRDAKLGAEVRKALKRAGCDAPYAVRDVAIRCFNCDLFVAHDIVLAIADALEAEAVPPAGDGCYKVAP